MVPNITCTSVLYCTDVKSDHFGLYYTHEQGSFVTLDLHILEMPSEPSVYILHINAESVSTASEFIANLKQSALNVTILAIDYNDSNEEVRRLYVLIM